jgi:hypothetical protein
MDVFRGLEQAFRTVQPTEVGEYEAVRDLELRDVKGLVEV